MGSFRERRPRGVRARSAKALAEKSAEKSAKPPAEKKGVGRRLALGLLAAGVLVPVGFVGGLAYVRPPFDGEAALETLTEIAHRGHRSYGAAERDRALQEIVDRFRPFVTGIEVHEVLVEHPDSRMPLTLRNVLLRQHPERTTRVILGSHWDTRLWAEEDPTPSRRGLPIVGANDGTSGIAVMIELARVLERRRIAVGVDYVLFDGEEHGRPGSQDYCQGSRAFGRELRTFYPESLPVFGLVLDMVGDRDLKLRKERFSLASAPAVVDLVWRAASDLGAPSFVEEPGLAIYDDHVPLIKAGVPSALIIDLDYPHWHTHQDTPDKCSASSLEEVGRVVLRALEEFSRTEERSSIRSASQSRP